MKSDQLNEIALALSKAQAQIKGAVKDAANPFFKSKYADLSAVWDACREALAANGLAVSQVMHKSGTGNDVLVTLLVHSSGQWIEGHYPVVPVKADPQSFGSAVTYARRYSLAAIVGVCSVEDDDGHTASRHEPPKVSQFTPRPKPTMQAAGDVLNREGLPPVAGEYVITWGISKGLKIKSVPPEVLDGYCKRIRDRATESGKDITGEAAEFLKHVTLFHIGTRPPKSVETGNGD